MGLDWGHLCSAEWPWVRSHDGGRPWGGQGHSAGGGLVTFSFWI